MELSEWGWIAGAPHAPQTLALEWLQARAELDRLLGPTAWAELARELARDRRGRGDSRGGSAN